MCLCVCAQMSWPGAQYTGSGQPDPSLLRQLFQLQQSRVPPDAGMTSSAQFSAATPQPPAQPSPAPAAMDNAMQMLLARAMSIPLATVLFQSLMGAQQPAAQPVFQPAPVLQPASTGALPGAQLQSALMQPALLQMMQQAFQTTATSAVTAQPLVPAPAAQHLPTPASSPSSTATSSAIQLPQMEPSVAKEMLVQLVQQLQQAGQLPFDDTLQRLLQPTADTSSQHVPQVEVKKENAATEQSTELNPLCVICKTESFEKAQPQVYMDIAEDINSVSTASTEGDVRRDLDGRSDEGEGVERQRKSHTRLAKNRQLVVSQRDAPVSQRRHKSSLSTSSADSDPKLQRKCVVKLDMVVDTERKPVITPPAPVRTSSVQTSTSPAQTTSSTASLQMSRVDKLKNMKNYNISTDILQNTSKSEAKPPVTATSSKEPAAQRSCPQDIKVPVNQQATGTSSTRVGTKNIFSIFAQRMSGRGVHQEEPVAEVRPSDPLPASVGVLLQRSINAAQNNTMSLRSMYLGYASENMEWLSLVSSVFSGNNKTFSQCSFCPKLGQYPRDVASHISGEHNDLLFSLNKLKPVAGPLVYIKCRHCNYVTVDSTLAWIHFDIHHGISDILDCSDRVVDLDLSGPDTPEVFIDIDSVMGSKTACVCFDCSAVNVDTDTTASSMLMARHVARHHPNSDNCNGNFVKLMMLTRNEGDPDSIRGSPTYRQAITNAEHMRGRREVFICMFCR